jgi:hypothetical protein
MTKEKPILMSAPMVLALLHNRKTQTRRTIKPQPKQYEGGTSFMDDGEGIWSAWSLEGDQQSFKCPYPVGTVLWAKECWRPVGPWECRKETVCYRADGAFEHKLGWPDTFKISASKDSIHKWRPSLFMGKWASRIRLEVTGVKVERLNSISNEDAVAEGIEVVGKSEEYSFSGCKTGKTHIHYKFYGKELERFKQQTTTPKWSYETLWESINGKGSWALNPWVWAYTFTRITNNY